VMGASPSLWWGQSVMLSALSTRVDTSILHACMLWPLGPPPWLIGCVCVLRLFCTQHLTTSCETSLRGLSLGPYTAHRTEPLAYPFALSPYHPLLPLPETCFKCLNTRAPPRTRPHVFAARVMVWASKPRASNRRCHETVSLSIRATVLF
jgi:hypothetical protein